VLPGTGYAREVRLDATPAIDAAAQPALLAALEQAGLGASESSAYDDAWRCAALREGVDDDDPPAGYALSPRSTLGATRA
jgi:hypothetical protein